MSPKTTPSAAKLKPAAPIAEAGLRFPPEILVTRIFYGSQYPAQRLSLTLVRSTTKERARVTDCRHRPATDARWRAASGGGCIFVTRPNRHL
jgi:hypothetical protein